MREEAKIFESILSTIENKDIREFAEVLIDTIPDYIFHAAASSSGKYHPKYALGDGGLVRHTCALVRILNHIISIDCMNKFTSRERDLMRVAGIMHDSRKSGTQEDYEKNKYTKFDHPLQAATVIREFKGKYLTEEEIELIATTIEAHMGQFNKDKKSDIVLPLPENKYQKMVHLADYLASRKDLEILFDEEFTKVQPPLPGLGNYILDFGKYKGKTLPEVKEIDPGYINWAKENMYREPARTLLKQL